MSDFGAQLKQAREHRGISLRQIATSTKISIVALEALERGDLTRLPGGIFSRAFVRAYALEVGLDPDAIVNQFLAELGVLAERRDDQAPRPEVTADDRAFLERQRKAWLALRVGVVVLVLLVILAIVSWQVAWRGDASGPGTAPSAASSPSPSTSTPASDAEAATPGPSVVPPASAPTTARLTVEIVASDRCWVQVTTDGSVVPAREFAAGDRQRFEANREVILQVGSAGAIRWTINGRAARSLGQLGEVKTVRVSAGNLSEFLQEPDASATGSPSVLLLQSNSRVPARRLR